MNLIVKKEEKKVIVTAKDLDDEEFRDLAHDIEFLVREFKKYKIFKYRWKQV